MGANSEISWTDHTFNPWIGCTKVSPACANCYAATLMDTRLGKVQWGAGKPRVRTSPENWKVPVRWNKHAGILAACFGEPRPRVFCASLADWLDDEVPIEWLADLLALIHATPHLDWLLLTKRPENWRSRLSDAVMHFITRPICDERDAALAMLKNWISAVRRPPANVWMGVTVENQEWADKRIPLLLSIPAKVRFLSCEPLLGPVDLHRIGHWKGEPLSAVDEIVGRVERPRVDWVIAGGESGRGARPMHPHWVRGLRDQCASSGVAFHFKQWGEFIEDTTHARFTKEHAKTVDVRLDPDCVMMRVGKKRAGRRLDGREWNGFPQHEGGAR